MDTSWFAFAPQGAVEYRREERSELCRREGIRPNVYYAWLKDFMEAGKTWLRVTPHGTTQVEVGGYALLREVWR